MMRLKYRNRCLLIAAVITALIALAIQISITLIFTKHVKINVISKFHVRGLTQTKYHKEFDRYGVSVAVSDSLIYFIDTSDSLVVKSYCYDFLGQRKTYFSFPKDTGYGRPFIDGGLYYLDNSSTLAYYNFNNKKVGVHGLDGKFLFDKKLTDGDKNPSQILGISEVGNALYYLSLEASKSNNKNYLKLYKESENHISIIDSVLFVPFRKDFWNIKEIMIDNYGSQTLGIFRIRDDEFLVRILKGDKESQIHVRSSLKKTPPDVTDVPAQFNLGSSFFVIGYWSPQLSFPRTFRIYDYKGKLMGRLKFRDDKNNELIDIVGNNIVAFNPTTSVVTIYSLSISDTE